MKKILFATSALVALTGAAAADITLDGDARLGLFYNNFGYTDDQGNEKSTVDVISRARVRFTMTGDTDSGLSFGAKFRAHEANDARDYNKPVGEVWIEGAYGKLSAGDVDSAIEAAVGHLPTVGLTTFDDANEFYYNSTELYGEYENKGLLYEYKYGDVSFYASFQDQYANNKIGPAKKYDGDAYSLGVGYSVGQYTFGIGYASDGLTINPFDSEVYGKSNTWAISGGTEWNGFVFKAVYMDTKVKADTAIGNNKFNVSQYGVGAEYAMANGVEFSGFYRAVDSDESVNGLNDGGKTDIIALGAAYDLGGGATLKGGIAHAKTKFDDAREKESGTLADFGLEFKF